jgi:hypothetical protein
MPDGSWAAPQVAALLGYRRKPSKDGTLTVREAGR